MAEKAEMNKYYGLLSKTLTNLKDVKEACGGYYEVLVEPLQPGKTKAYKCVFRLRQSYLNSRSNVQAEQPPQLSINQFYEIQLKGATESYCDFMQLTHVINIWLIDIRKEFSRDKYRIIVLTQMDDVEPRTHPDPDSDSDSEKNFSHDSDCESEDDTTPKPYVKKCAFGHTQSFPTNSKKTKLRICTECLDKLGKKFKFAIYTYNTISVN